MNTTFKATRGDRPTEPLIFEKDNPAIGSAVALPALEVPPTEPDADLLGPEPNLPALGECDVARHYQHLADRNFSVDRNFYPLGSCTMKYNPKINEVAASLPAMINAHPLQCDSDVQGILKMLYELGEYLKEIAGLPAVSLQPCAGAHGEWTALKVIRAYFKDPDGGNQPQRTQVLAPDTAHGTNFASCTMCGTNVVLVKSKDGLVDMDDLKSKIDDTTAAMMITNPNTAGLFDGQIGRIAELLHEAGAMLYLDGANMNAIMGITRPGDFGVDAMHYNTHKTLSTPHGCGGPGAGPIAVNAQLAPYLPVPEVECDDDQYRLTWARPKSIGKVRSFFGQVGVLIRAWAYIRSCGANGLKQVSQTAVLNANYLASQLQHRYEMPYFDPDNGRYCAHEFVTVPKSLLAGGVTLIDMAKRMIDYGIHPPTMHWPVHDCLMIEPCESESLATLDRFVQVMLQIADEADQSPDQLRQSPQSADVNRLDEVAAARKPVLNYDASLSS